MRTILISIILVICTTMIFAQDNESSQKSDTLRKDALNVFYPSASSHLKQEISYINYVRDRKVADLVIISTSERTGSGGRKHTLFLEGQGKFSFMQDTLTFTSNPDETYEMTREKRIKTLQMGLMRYIIKTPLNKFININFSEPMSDEVSTDKWNSWVFSAGLHGFGFANKSRDVYNFSTNISANRITADWKLEFDTYYNLELIEFRWEDDITGEDMSEMNRAKSSSIDGLVVKSLGEHWSIGFKTELSSSYYSNYVTHFEFKPGIEYNIFPFSQSTRKQFRFMYTIGPVYNNYYDTTIFFKVNEIVGQQSLMAAYKNIQKWGDFNISTSWDNYLHDWDLSRLSFDVSVGLRVAKGLRVNFSGGYKFIHDQINLRKGSASSSDVLIGRKEMATTYSYNGFVGITYTFGSIYNNAVNPRFSRSGGGRIIMF